MKPVKIKFSYYSQNVYNTILFITCWCRDVSTKVRHFVSILVIDCTTICNIKRYCWYSSLCCRVFFERKFEMGDDDASYANSVLYVSSAAFSPVSGYIVDKTGRNVFWVSVSIFCTIIAHGMLAFTLVNPYITMVSLFFNFYHKPCQIWNESRSAWSTNLLNGVLPYCNHYLDIQHF